MSDSPFVLALKALGNTSESITAALREKGIKGYRSSACRCPIAKYLNACGFADVTIGQNASRYSNARMEPEERIPLPEVIGTWVRSFDAGNYPEFILQ